MLGSGRRIMVSLSLLHIAGKQRSEVKALCNNCDLGFLKSNSLIIALMVKVAYLKLAIIPNC